jgi:cytochrome c oxidase subunit 1
MKARLALPIAWAALAVWMVVLGAAPVLIFNGGLDYTYQDTYYVVAHWRYMASFIGACAVFGLVYFAFPPSGRLQSGLGWAHLASIALGFTLMIAPQYLLTNQGMPRRYEDYPATFQALNSYVNLGYGVSLLGLAPFVGLLALKGIGATRNRIRPRA